MAYSYTKLFQTILQSTIWCEPDSVRVVWITLLAMADRDGLVHASVPGLAKEANVSILQASDALKRFKSPDEYSRTQEHEGRRIEDVDGGWRLLNHAKYRAIGSSEAERERKRRWWRENRGKGSRPQGAEDDPD